MARRDVGNEVVVALAVIGMLALALTFAVVLTLSRTVPPPSMTATASAATALALVSQASTVTAVPATLPATESATTQATTAVAPSQSPTALPSATIPATNTPVPPRPTSPSTNTPTDTPTPTSTALPSPTLTLVTQATENVVTTVPLVPQLSPTAGITVVATSSAPALPDDVTSATPIMDAGILPTAIGGSGVLASATPCTRPGNWIPYTIQAGDTLFGISVRYGVPLLQLQGFNCLVKPGSIYAGQVILVPPNVLPTTFFATNAPLYPTAAAGGSGNAALCPDPNVRITSPISGSAFSGKFTVMGTANIPNFSYYVIDYRFYTEWDRPFNSFGNNQVPVTNGVLTVFDPAPSRLPPGSYTIRLRVVDKYGGSPAPCSIQVALQ
ncbi:MAG TPA: LysM peptidoglycan-binding domain-containing protein [Aggregatilineales bacterium]|nr:LysM peptidoglycan-binding domain-containing protein [Aggregatilineales bacterium]